MGETTTTTEQLETRAIPALSLRAAIRPGSVDPEKRTVEVIWTTGAKVLRGFFEKFYEELSLDPKHVRMDRLSGGRAPLLDSHGARDLSSVLGVVESARLEGKRGVATVRFAKAEDDPEADRIFRKVMDGIIGNISVGYRVYRFEKTEGGEKTLPTFRAVDWEPFELSLVGMPADPGAAIRAAVAGEELPCTFVSWEERDMGDKNKTTAATEPQATEPQAPQTSPAVSSGDDTRGAVEAATRAERERVTGIRTSVRAARLDESLADELIADGTELDAARALILERLAEGDERTPTQNHIQIEGGATADEKRLRGMEAALLHRIGFGPVIEQAKKRGGRIAAELATVETDPGEFRGISLMSACRHLLEARGVRTSRMRDGQLYEAMLRGGYQTTSDFAVLFENVMHKSVLAAFAVQPDTWRKFCGVDTVPDFRDSNRYRTGALDVLEEVDEHGEFKNKAIPDGERQTISTATKGNIYSVSRQTLVNDDMGALNDLFAKMGRAAARTIEEDVYALLQANGGLGPTQGDGQPLFHANRANVNSVASELSVKGIDADRVLMLKQKDISGREFLDLRPAVLLVPLGLGSQARLINEMQYSGEEKKYQVPNVVRGLFSEVVESPRLTDATRRYLLADPDLHPLIKVVFLEETGEAPVIQSKDGWRIDGIEYRVRIDAKAQVFEPKAGVTNAGTA